MTFESSLAYKALYPHFQQRVQAQEPLALHSSFGVGGPADLWVTLETRQELNDLISVCARERWPLLVVGAGSNILYADAGVRGIVASLALSSFTVEEQPDQSALVIAEAGVRWSRLLDALVPLGWGGLEFGAGIPGTLGGGIVSNAGAHNQDLGQALEWIEVLDARNCNEGGDEPIIFPVIVQRRYPRESLNLSYRHSRFRENRLVQIDEQGQLVLPVRLLIEPAELVVTLALRVQRQDPLMLAAQLEAHRRERKGSDPAQKHLGSIFKDPQDSSASSARVLIEQAGVAGLSCGKAQISPYNANYIVNLGGASATDIVSLIVEAHQRVLATSGIHLMLNVELAGAW
ncbi:MAG TPA: UDP-N-acetylmuramate dehydrogenase [Ktedonobacteraceae bacterium]|jgi:UDP-N-acetylmuramate dehydrogenase|nr:UDP-N-acetylmuramate dehydrogenase [Ktedonobacteraceae bacterium]